MAGNPFDRIIEYLLEKGMSGDINLLQAQLDYTLRYNIERLTRHMSLSGSGVDPVGRDPRDQFIGDSLMVQPTATPSMVVNVLPGIGYQFNNLDVPTNITVGGSKAGAIAGLNDQANVKPVVLLGQHQFTVPTAPVTPNSRIDLIEVHYKRFLNDLQSREFFNTSSRAYDLISGVQKTMGFVIDGDFGVVNAPANSTAALSYKVGVAGNPGVAPSVSPNGYVPLSYIRVGSGVTSIDNDVITDERALLFPFNQFTVSGRITENGSQAVISDWNGPPGVRAAAVYLPGAGLSGVNLWIQAGAGFDAGTPGKILPYVNVTDINSVFHGAFALAHANTLTVDSTIQAQLASAAAGVPMKVAIGQNLALVQISARDKTDTDVALANYQFIVHCGVH